MKSSQRHLWWLLAPLLILLVGVVIQAFFHARQKTATQNIERLGGRVLTTHGEPDWLRRLTGGKPLKLFQKATVVNLSETEISDADLRELENLTGLERLNLSETEITDQGLKHLADLTDLKALDLSGTQIQGPGLEHLQNLTRLEYLYLSGTQISDGDLPHLNPYENLRLLDLTGTNVSPAGIEKIKRQRPDLEVNPEEE